METKSFLTVSKHSNQGCLREKKKGGGVVVKVFLIVERQAHKCEHLSRVILAPMRSSLCFFISNLNFHYYSYGSIFLRLYYHPSWPSALIRREWGGRHSLQQTPNGITCNYTPARWSRCIQREHSQDQRLRLYESHLILNTRVGLTRWPWALRRHPEPPENRQV